MYRHGGRGLPLFPKKELDRDGIVGGVCGCILCGEMCNCSKRMEFPDRGVCMVDIEVGEGGAAGAAFEADAREGYRYTIIPTISSKSPSPRLDEFLLGRKGRTNTTPSPAPQYSPPTPHAIHTTASPSQVPTSPAQGSCNRT